MCVHRHTGKPNNIYDRTVFAMENLLISRSHLFCDFIDVIRWKGDYACRSSPIHLVNNDTQPIRFAVEYGCTGRGVFDYEILPRFFNDCIDPSFFQRGLSVEVSTQLAQGNNFVQWKRVNRVGRTRYMGKSPFVFFLALFLDRQNESQVQVGVLEQ